MSLTRYAYQDESNKRGEVVFRKKVSDEVREHPEMIMQMMFDRINETIAVFKRLEKKYSIGINGDMNFGEVGAERAQRILSMIDHYKLKSAFAFDISPDSLSLSEIVSQRCFTPASDGKLPHEKLTLVADDFLKAPENIQGKKLDFIFCFATIHHFPDPRPLFKTVYSMLNDGGYFYFDREALKSWLGLHELARFRGYLRAGKIVEREYGILETQFGLQTWREAIETFEYSDVRLKYPLPVLENIYNFDFRKVAGNPFMRTMLQLSGSRIYGILRKKKPFNSI